MKWKIFIAVVMLTTVMFSQQDTAQDSLRVINRLMYNNQSKLTIGGYVQIDYNEPDGSKAGNRTQKGSGPAAGASKEGRAENRAAETIG